MIYNVKHLLLIIKINGGVFVYLEYEDFMFDCVSRDLSPKTIKSYRNTTKLFLKYVDEELKIKDIQDIKPIHIKKYLKSKSDAGGKGTYINGILKVLRAFFTYCLDEGYIIQNPTEKIRFVSEEKTIIETFTDEEVSRMLNVYGFTDYLSARNKTILALQFDTGIRTTETVEILNSFIQEDRIFIMGKGKKQRYISLSIKLRKIFKRYEKIKFLYFQGKEMPDNYFLSRTGRPLTVEAIERIYRKAGEIAKVRDNIRCSPHTARHYFAIKMLQTHDIYTVSKLLGHGKVNTTEIYLKSLDSLKLIEQGNIVSPLMSIRK